MESEEKLQEAISELKKHSGIFEVHKETSFTCYRTTSSGGQQEIKVTINDMGDSNSSSRYSCNAVSEDGKFATGNPADTIRMALFNVHWNELDK